MFLLQFCPTFIFFPALFQTIKLSFTQFQAALKNPTFSNVSNCVTGFPINLKCLVLQGCTELKSIDVRKILNRQVSFVLGSFILIRGCFVVLFSRYFLTNNKMFFLAKCSILSFFLFRTPSLEKLNICDIPKIDDKVFLNIPSKCPKLAKIYFGANLILPMLYKIICLFRLNLFNIINFSET